MVDLLALLESAIANPFVYFGLVFVYSILIAIVLPIPIETALLLPLQQGSLSLFTAALFAVAFGKAVGAWLVFLLGVKVGGVIDRWTSGPSWTARLTVALERPFRDSGSLDRFRWWTTGTPWVIVAARKALRETGMENRLRRWESSPPWVARVVAAFEKFVRWSGTIGLYTLLSVPLMSDTLPIYFYAVFNEEGRALDRRQFILSNFLAGFNRVAILFILALTLWPGLLRIP